MKASGSDLVLSMTLAECFLLLLFVIWWGTALEGQAADEGPTILQEQVKVLKARVETLEHKNRELELSIEALRDMLGSKDLSHEEIENAIKRRVEAGVKEELEKKRRGSPKCLEDNVLVRAYVTDGAERLVVLQSADGILDDQARSKIGRLPAGRELESPDEVVFFLGAVRRYYSRRSDCRFDYRLVYRTDRDYRIARSRLEQYFYPAQIARVE